MTDLRRAEEAVLDDAKDIYNDFTEAEVEKMTTSIRRLWHSYAALSALRASQAGEPPVCVCGCHAMEHQNDPQDSHCRKCYKCDDFTPAPTPPAEEADGICDSFGHRQSCRVYRGGTCDAPPAEEAGPKCDKTKPCVHPIGTCPRNPCGI